MKTATLHFGDYRIESYNSAVFGGERWFLDIAVNIAPCSNAVRLENLGCYKSRTDATKAMAQHRGEAKPRGKGR